ncbi:MAG: hypothetical protein ACYTGN_06880 [Planctomycetota bacterium]|jgi:hypothetical protein
MSSTGIYSQEEIRAATELVKELIKTTRSFRLYDARHPALERMVAKLQMRWEAATAGGPVTLTLTPHEVRMEGQTLHKAPGNRDVIPTLLHDDGVIGLVFSAGVDADEVRLVTSILSGDADADFGTLFWEAELKATQALVDFDGAEPVSGDAKELQKKIEEIGDDSDPERGPEGLDREHLERSPATVLEEDDGADAYELSEQEYASIDAAVEADTNAETVRHAMRVIHALAREPMPADDGEQLEHVLAILVSSTSKTGDLDGTIEVLGRSARLAETGSDQEQHFGEATHAAFLERRNLEALFRRLDDEEFLDARVLGDLLAQLGPAAAGGAVEWLLTTQHVTIAVQSLRLFGSAASNAVIARYKSANSEERPRLLPALLEIATRDALALAATDFALLSEEQRLALMRKMDRCDDHMARRAILEGLKDVSPGVRRAAADAMRPADAPGLADMLARMFERGAFDHQTEEDVKDLFEMVARVGDREVAKILAAQCRFGGLKRAFARVKPLQEMCLRTMRRMRDPGAREVVERVRASAPKAVRELLENPFGI